MGLVHHTLQRQGIEVLLIAESDGAHVLIEAVAEARQSPGRRGISLIWINVKISNHDNIDNHMT